MKTNPHLVQIDLSTKGKSLVMQESESDHLSLFFGGWESNQFTTQHATKS